MGQSWKDIKTLRVSNSIVWRCEYSSPICARVVELIITSSANCLGHCLCEMIFWWIAIHNKWLLNCCKPNRHLGFLWLFDCWVYLVQNFAFARFWCARVVRCDCNHNPIWMGRTDIHKTIVFSQERSSYPKFGGSQFLLPSMQVMFWCSWRKPQKQRNWNEGNPGSELSEVM